MGEAPEGQAHRQGQRSCLFKWLLLSGEEEACRAMASSSPSGFTWKLGPAPLPVELKWAWEGLLLHPPPLPHRTA